MKKILIATFTLIYIFTISITVGAEGQADVNSNITFFEETSQTNDDKKETNTSETEEKKGYSALPQTGEIIKKYSLWIFIIAAVLIIFVLLKRNRVNNNE